MNIGVFADRDSRYPLGASIVVMVLVFCLDAFSGLDVEFCILYLVSIILSSYWRQKSLLVITTVTCTFLTVIAYGVSQIGIPAHTAITDRTLAVFSFSIAAALLSRKRLIEESLEETERRFNLMATAVNEVFWMSDITTGRLIYISPGYESVWQRTCKSLYDNPRSFVDAIYEEDRGMVLANFPVQREGRPFEYEYRIVMPDGKIKWIWDRGFPIIKSGRPPEIYAGVATDITARKKAEKIILEKQEQLAFLNRICSETEERERKQIVEELHDRVGQNLTAIGINLDIVRTKFVSRKDPELDRIDDAIRLLKEMTDKTRDIMASLRPPVLDDYGLSAALKWYAERFSRRSDIKIRFTGNEFSPRLAAEKEIQMFRIAQEALSNIAKYAAATLVDVTFDEVGKNARMTIHDNGSGFDYEALKKPDGVRGWGILSMKERAKISGGGFRMESRPGQGTKVIVEIPK